MPMLPTSLNKSAIIAVLLTCIAIASWEYYLRKQEIPISYDNLSPLWAHKRAKVYTPSDKATVFIGASRIKFDLDTDEWKSITGTEAIQLAWEGSNPIPVLLDLAADQKFKGNLVVDVTEELFFTPAIGQNVESPNNAIKYYKEETPAQKVGSVINNFFESQFVFLDKESLSLSALLDQVHIKNRANVVSLPTFPIEFFRVKFSRQTYMTPKMIADTLIQQKVQGIWTYYAKMAEKEPPLTDSMINAAMQTVKTAVDKMKARGCKIYFVRTPSSGPMLMGENMGFPREKFWNKLVEFTGCPAIHFMDYPEINHFVCPEWSHLSPADAIVFTRAFAKILREEKGFSNAVYKED